MHVEAAGEQVGSDDGVNRANSELLNVLISLFLCHVTKDEGDLVPIVLEPSKELLCEVLGVHENNCLGALRERVVDLLDEVDLAPGWALVVELLHVLKLLFINSNLDKNCLLNDLGNLITDLFVVGG